jgi:hypothetical protein
LHNQVKFYLMAHLVQSNLLSPENAFAFTQFSLGGAKQVVGGIELVMATFIPMIKHGQYGK